MGEVYRARDTKLKRDVAIKVLPDAFAGDPERLARFRARSAKCSPRSIIRTSRAIYGLEDADGTPAPGAGTGRRATRWRIASRAGRFRSTRRCTIARQIADALEAAHEHGHRPSRSEARQHQAHAGRRRSRCSTSVWRRPSSRRRGSDRDLVAVADDAAYGDARCGRDPRHGRVHEPGAGARAGRRQAHRHLGVRCACSTKC